MGRARTSDSSPSRTLGSRAAHRSGSVSPGVFKWRPHRQRLAGLGTAAGREGGRISRSVAPSPGHAGAPARYRHESPARPDRPIAAGCERPADDLERSRRPRSRRAVRHRRPYGHASCAPDAPTERTGRRDPARATRLRADRQPGHCRICLPARCARFRVTGRGAGVRLPLGVLDRGAAGACTRLRSVCAARLAVSDCDGPAFERALQAACA